jgi:chaperonin cofactor prefoldin
MAPTKKAAGKRIVRFGPEPPDIQDVLDEISELRGSLDTLVALVYSLQQSIKDIKESIDELQD